MADDADRAQAQIEAELEASIAAARPKQGGAESADECAECGSEIPSLRQIAVPGTIYCAFCAGIIERKAKR